VLLGMTGLSVQMGNLYYGTSLHDQLCPLKTFIRTDFGLQSLQLGQSLTERVFWS